MFGEAGNDTLSGGAGHDFLDGGAGTDIVTRTGALSDYTFFVGPEGKTTLVDNRSWAAAGSTDAVDGVSTVVGDGIDTVQDVEVLRFADGDRRLVAGTVGDDALTATYDPDVVLAGAGNDQVWAADGGDLLDGGAGVDTIDYSGAFEGRIINLSGGTATSTDGTAVDTITNFENAYGTGFGDVIYGTAEANVLDALEGADWIEGFGGDDSLSGGAGTDGVFGGAGNDTLSGGAGHDFLNGGEGTDTVVMTGALSDYTFFVGPEGKTTLVDNRSWAAGAGAVDGVSTVVGDGIDTVQDVEVLRFADGDVGLRTSTAASEVLTGGAGADLFVFAAGFGKDTITNFTAGTDDIVFAKDVFGSYDLVAAAASQVDADVVITLDADTTLTLANVQLSALGADDFRFV